MTFPSAARISAAAVALAALVVLATGGPPVWVPRGAGWVDRSELVAALVLFLALGAIFSTVTALAAHRVVVRKESPETPARHTLLRAIPPAVVALVLLGMWGIAGGRFGEPPADGTVPELRLPSLIGQALLFSDSRDAPVTANAAREEGGVSLEELTGLSRIRLLAAVILLAAITVLGAWKLAGARVVVRPGEEEDPEGPGLRDRTPDRAATRRAVVHSIDEMLADPDPDTAVIGAYARLLEGLKASGAPRREHEGPMEHLRRVLSLLDVRPGPLRDLVRLFETARFAPVSLTAGHRDRAIAALREVADDLTETPVAGTVAGGLRTRTAGDPE